MRLISCLVVAAALTSPAVAAPLSGPEKAAYACILAQAKTGIGNPLVRANNAAEKCAMDGLSEAQREKVVDMAARRLMRGAGQRCIGVGCG